CIWSGTFEGARGAVSIGMSRLAAAAPFSMPALPPGPLPVLSLPSFLPRRQSFRTEAAITALIVGLLMLYFVTLTSEPIWIGWRAGQILLVTLPALAAATIAALHDRGPRLAATLVGAAFCGGVPPATLHTPTPAGIH